MGVNPQYLLGPSWQWSPLPIAVLVLAWSIFKEVRERRTWRAYSRMEDERNRVIASKK